MPGGETGLGREDFLCLASAMRAEYYSALSEEKLKTGLVNLAKHPPDDTSFLTTRPWEKYLPRFARNKGKAKRATRPRSRQEADRRIKIECPILLNFSHDERDSDKLDHFTVIRNVRLRKDKWQRFSSELEERMLEEKRGEHNK